MRKLLIPDIHERWQRLQQLEPLIDEAGLVVVMGDLTDAYRQKGFARDVVYWAKERLDDDKFEFLIGNHDAHYLFRHHLFRCSGYNRDNQELFDRVFTDDDKRKFKLFARVNNRLVSHAGFHQQTIHFADANTANEAIERAIAGGFHDVFRYGKARCGCDRNEICRSHAPIGGPTWQDWNFEFEPISATPQVVGHTNGKEVREKGANYCIDTGLNHVAWIDGPNIEFVNLNESNQKPCEACGVSNAQ